MISTSLPHGVIGHSVCFLSCVITADDLCGFFFLCLGLTSRIKKQCFRLIRKIPFVGDNVSFVVNLFLLCALIAVCDSCESLRDDHMEEEGGTLAHFALMISWTL